MLGEGSFQESISAGGVKAQLHSGKVSLIVLCASHRKGI